jgi:hypothetical protein
MRMQKSMYKRRCDELRRRESHGDEDATDAGRLFICQSAYRSLPHLPTYCARFLLLACSRACSISAVNVPKSGPKNRV